MAHPQKGRLAREPFGPRLRWVRAASAAYGVAYLKRTIAHLRVRRYRRIPGPSTLSRMQRLFSVFPGGWPGVGLLLLRLSVAAACLQAYIRCETHSTWFLFALIPMSACLCAGALTPVAALLALALQLTAVALWVNGAYLVVITILDASALALLGPGAYSLDALRFGRRVILAESWRDRDSD